MKTNETSTRQQALAWWENLSEMSVYKLTNKYNYQSRRNRADLTDKEIEEIWRKEMQKLDEDAAAFEYAVFDDGSNYPKPNQKQFKDFDSELFKAYIEKFSLDDKAKALLDLCDSMGMRQITGETYKFGNIEYKLSPDDRDYVTFHKTNHHHILDTLMVCDYETTPEPIYKDWYMSINYHS